MRAIPTINTQRLTLRSMRPQDFERYAEIWRHCEVVRFVGGTPWEEGRAWQSFLRNAGHWHMVGYGQWAIEPHGAARMMGQAGFFRAMLGLGDDFDGHPEAGWMLHPDAQGQGLGADAALAAHEWFDRVVTGPLVCKISLENWRSLRIAKELGYADLRDIEMDGDMVRLLFRKGPPGMPRNLLA